MKRKITKCPIEIEAKKLMEKGQPDTKYKNPQIQGNENTINLRCD